MFRNISNNKYDIFILFLIVSTIFGNVGGALSVPRITGLLLITHLLNIFNKEKMPFITSLKRWCFIFYIYALISFMWTPDQSQAFKELFYYFVHFVIFFEVIVFSKKAKNPLVFITLSFIFCVLFTSLIAFWELSTDNHLPYSSADEASATRMDNEVIARNFAAVTFGNLNTYVTYLCLSIPFILYGMTIENKIVKNLSISALVIAVILVLCNASRGGFLSVLLCIALYLFMIPKNKSVIFTFMVLLLVLSFLLYMNRDSILLIISIRLAEEGIASDDSRFEIWINALKVFFDYAGLGSGIGGMNMAMAKYSKYGITITHNLFLEILCQYGLVFCLAFVFFLINMLITSRKFFCIKRNILVTISILSFPITCIINSGYLLDPHLYIVLASIYVFANYERIRPVY